MNARFALSIAPILILALGTQAEAATTKSEVHHGSHARTTAAASRHTKTRTAAARGHQVKARHVAVRHVDGRHIAYGKSSRHGLTDADGWNPVTAGISYPNGKPIGATVQLASLTEADDASSNVGALTDAAPLQRGIASYYGGRHNGRRAADGSIFNQHALTAAHATLPFGTKVLVRVAGTDRTVTVTITDRLYARHRVIDLSEGAAQQLGIVRQGLAMVTLTPQN
ncbi:septal ring lytic transglycosylase RlpA family protein [Acidisoma sp. 7E03]